MAQDYRAVYPAGISTTDANYPYGKPRNVSAQGAGDGTPWEAAIGQDIFGFLQAILTNGGIVPSGVPDNSSTSQYLQALRAIMTDIATAGGFDRADIDGFIRIAIDNLLDGAPAALDTLYELAAALNDDAAFSQTVMAQIALRAPLVSPVFTGEPMAPTPGEGNDTARLATTEFVERAARALDVTRLSRATSGGSISAGVTTSVGPIQITKTGTWAIVLRATLSGFPSSRQVTMTIAGVTVYGLETGTASSGASGTYGGSFSLILERNNGDNISGSVYSNLTHTLSTVRLEAFYMGPSA